MIRRARRVLLFVPVLLLLSPAALPAPADGDLRLSDFTRETPGGSPAFAPRKGEGMGRTLDLLLAGRTLPIPCASSLLLELRRSGEALPYPVRDSLRILSLRPALPHDGTHLSRDGRFVIHYTLDAGSPDSIDGADSDLNGVPDRVDRVEAALDLAVEVLAAEMSWPLPASDPRSDHYDVYLVNLGPGRGGFTVLDREIAATYRSDAPSHIVVDGRMDPSQMEAAVIHQFAHASLLTLSTGAPAWWTEATAAWMETRVTRNPSPHRDALARRLERLDLSLAGDSLLLSLGNSLWVSFLAEREGGDGEAVRQIWLEQSARGAEPFLDLLDGVLRRNDGGGTAGAFREYTRWTLFTGPRDDSAHFLLGPLFPPLVPRSTHEVLPAESPGYEPVEPMGAAVHRLVGDGSRGGARFRFEVEVPSLLEVDLVVTPSEGDRRPYLVEMDPDPAGRAEVGVPWRGVAEAMVIVRNPAPGGKPIRYRFTATLDPLFPYDLSSLAALPSGAGITLQWSTGREADLLGWNVYRSSGPNGPFLRINPVTLPSGGDSQEETDYIYQDSSAAEGRRYFYLVEGITVQGLPERSFPVSAESPEPDPFP